MVNKKGKNRKGKKGKAGKKGAFNRSKHPRKANGQFKRRK